MSNKPRFSELKGRERIEKRFWPRVNKAEGCWEWTGSLFQKTGYGQFSIGYNNYLSHRVSWWLTNGDPEDRCVLHSCDNPKCVRPDHLFLGTFSDNTRDAIKKGRLQIKAGEQCSYAKLTSEDVRTIRRLFSNKEKRNCELAATYNVVPSCITNIVNRRRWKHVE